jgi:predicted phosphate transport protein (TIGR00153 family)
MNTSQSEAVFLAPDDGPLMKRSLDFIFQLLLPKDKKFYPLFDQACANLEEVSKLFSRSMKADSVVRIQALEEIDRLERQGDEITHAIITELSTTFIVPFDREDIQALANAIDDIVDLIYGTSKRIDLYKVHSISPEMIRLSEIIHECAIELRSALKAMRNLRNAGMVRQRMKQINLLENEADLIMNQFVGKLFREEKDATQLMKQQEVITMLELATDKCEDAANVLQSVLIKFS